LCFLAVHAMFYILLQYISCIRIFDDKFDRLNNIVFASLVVLFRPLRMHEMQAIATDDCRVCLSVCLFVTRLNTASLCKNG